MTATMNIIENCSPRRNMANDAAAQNPMKPTLSLYTMLSFCPALNLRENIGILDTSNAESTIVSPGMKNLVPAHGARKLSGVLQI